MRDHTCPHPIKTTVYFLSDALKKLRKVGAKVDSAAYNEVVYLWRGIKGRALIKPPFSLSSHRIFYNNDSKPKHANSSKRKAGSRQRF